MKMITPAAGLAAALTFMPMAQAQQIEWQQISAPPLGENVPAGLSVDILGVAPGMTFDAARDVILALAPDGATEAPVLDATARRAGAPNTPDYQEQSVIMTLPVGSSSSIEAEYPSRISLARQYGENNSIRDTLMADFSAPSSGHQAMMIYRAISYNRQEDQPRISEILANLNSKFGAEPAAFPTRDGSSVEYIWRYDEGQPVPVTNLLECGHQASAETAEQSVADINGRGTCDFVITLRINRGISDDHAESFDMRMTDNDRGKANLATDYAFMWDYVDQVQSGSGGATPAF